MALVNWVYGVNWTDKKSSGLDLNKLLTSEWTVNTTSSNAEIESFSSNPFRLELNSVGNGAATTPRATTNNYFDITDFKTMAVSGAVLNNYTTSLRISLVSTGGTITEIYASPVSGGVEKSFSSSIDISGYDGSCAVRVYLAVTNFETGAFVEFSKFLIS